MVPNQPGYLTDARLAHAERDRWETDFAAGLRTMAVHASTGAALTAASFPFWDRAVRQFVTQVRRVPRAVVGWLLAHKPSEDESYDEVVNRLAATLATAAFNDHMLRELANYGIPYKRWTTQHDARVRPAHAHADGQVRPLSQPFVIAGNLMMYPADGRTAPIELWANDRCVIIGQASL